MAGYIGSKAVITSGVSASIDELNIIDGVTATTAELNTLDGVTAVVGELNALDIGSTAVGTAVASKAVILDSNKDYTGLRNITLTGELDAGSLDISGNADIDGTLETDALSIAGVTVTTTAAEINLIDGGTARGTTAIADGDGVLINDAGTMRQTSVETLATYMGTKGLGPAYTRGTTAPSSPNAGDWWNNTGNTSIYIYDATDGWVTNGAQDFGAGSYQVPGNYSLIFTGGLNRVSFQGPGVGTTETGAYVESIIPNVGDGAFGLSNSVRGVFGSGNAVTMAFVTMATSAAAQDFGDTVRTHPYGPQSASHATRGLIAGGYGSPALNEIDYITIANAGDATDFGNLTVARSALPASAMTSTVRAIFHRGEDNNSGAVNTMDYVTVANTGNATDFGDVGGTIDDQGGCGVNSTTRGIMAGNAEAATNTIEYITMGTAGNSTDFGNLTATDNSRCAIHSSTLAYLHGGEDVITMATAANATASGYAFRFIGLNDAVCPGWIAYNG